MVQSLFTHSLKTGLRDETVRNKFRIALKTGESSDEELMETMNKIVSVEGERQLKFNASGKRPTVSSINDNNQNPAREDKDMSKVMSTLEALQTQIAELNAKVKEQSNSFASSAQEKPSKEYSRRRKTCQDCEQRNISQCNHCFKCGSTDHMARGCKNVQRNQGNGYLLLPPRDKE